jgi:Pyridoxamine 5'-phosphate oxidase
VKQRDKVAMTGAETHELLASQHKVQLATNGNDGFPHLVTMYYALIDGQITFWTYRRSQKAKNLERDPRISCLVETGEQYFDLRGVLIQGVARRIEVPAAIAEVGRLIAAVLAGPGGPGPDPAEPPATPPSPSPAPANPQATPPSPSPGPGPAEAAQADALTEYVERAARKRYSYTVEPSRVISWDHAKLLPPS